MQGSEVQLALDRKLERRGYWFDSELANRAQIFFEHYINHSQGRWAGQPFRLEPWQLRLIRRLFGWCRPDGTRRYRRLLLWVPRKNGKSTLASGIALFLLFADGEAGAQVFAAAGNKDQAEIVFGEGKNMVRASPELDDRAETLKNSIFVPESLGRFQAISSKAHTKHGLNPHGVICDEIHVWPDRDLYDVLTSASGARRQPLEVVISTAGSDIGSFGKELFDTALKLRDGILEDPDTLAEVFCADPEDDYADPQVWRKANPNLGVSITEDYLRAELEKVKQTPGRLAAFKQMYLNIWSQDIKAWLSIDAWRKCGGKRVPWAKYAGRRCWGGLDLSTTTDLTAFVLVFPNEGDTFDVVSHFWCPEERIQYRAKVDRVQYPLWVQEKCIHSTPGNVVDYEHIEAFIAGLLPQIDLLEIAYDPWNATEFAQRLQDKHGITMAKTRQGFQTLSEPSKQLERLVLSRRIRHDGNPALTWMVSNVVVDTDPAGNIKPNKAKSRERIDGVVALVMALSRASLDQGPSVYDGRGLITV